MKFIVIILSIIILSANNNIFAQKEYPGNCLIKIAAGHGFYSPSNKIESAYAFSLDDEVKYGGIGVNIRVLFKTKIFHSRLKLGGEIGGATYRTGSYPSEHLVWEDTGEPVKKTRILTGIYFQFISDLYIFSIGSVDFQLESGLGFQFFRDTGSFGIPFYPTIELLSSAKLITAIPISSWATIDPQIGILKSLSSNDIFALNIVLGVTLAWKKFIKA